MSLPKKFEFDLSQDPYKSILEYKDSVDGVINKLLSDMRSAHSTNLQTCVDNLKLVSKSLETEICNRMFKAMVK